MTSDTSSAGWEGETLYDWEGDARADEEAAKRTAHYTVIFTISYDPEEVSDIRSWMTVPYLNEVIAVDNNIDIAGVAIEKHKEEQ